MFDKPGPHALYSSFPPPSQSAASNPSHAQHGRRTSLTGGPDPHGPRGPSTRAPESDMGPNTWYAPGPSNGSSHQPGYVQGASPNSNVAGGSSMYPNNLAALAQLQQQAQQPTADGKKAAKRRPAEGESPNGAEEKRTKTGRACDACRSKKIRCDILPADSVTGEQPICAHCKQYNIECTFFLPITETRFKKRRAAADEASTRPSRSESNGSGDLKPSGPASILSLVHTALPNRSFEQFDMDNHAYWEVREDENGVIHVEVAADAERGEGSSRVTKYVLPPHLMSTLVNAYFEDGNEYLPIVSRREFIDSRKPYPLLLYSICGLTATRRDYPRQTFNRLRGLVNGLLRANDILSHARIEHVQSLLIMAETGELHAQPTAPTASAAMMRLSCAVRMAQDLGLHREQPQGPDTMNSLIGMERVELRRRIWAACVFMERWYAAALGLPLLIDVHDCDVPLPSPYKLQPDGPPVLELTYATLAENLKLALILGRVLKAVYGPTGLQNASDDKLTNILDDMQQWRDNLPDQLKFTGPDSSILAGLLHMEFTAVQFVFWRGFMRHTPAPPSHLALTLDMSRWSKLVQLSRQSIEWLDSHNLVLDTVFIFSYTATSCALVQYHMWARRRDPSSLETLKLTRDVIQRWEAALQPDQMSIRKKSCETMTLLYEAALKTNPDTEDRTDRSEGTPNSTGSVGRSEQPAFGSRRGYTLGGVTVEGDGPHVVQYPQEADKTAATTLDEPYDVAFLDNLPDSNFDWSGWGQYFDSVDRMFPTPPQVEEIPK